MPAILNSSSVPVSYVVYLRVRNGVMGGTEIVKVEGPNAKSTIKDGDIQIMEEGVGVWKGRTRTLYPWHRIAQVEEVF